MTTDDKYYTDLDIQLQQLAITDWATLAKMMGPYAILGAKVHLLNSRGNSLQQVANRLDTTVSVVRHHLRKSVKI